MSFIEQPTRKRLGDIVMTSRGYVRRTRKGFVPWTPEARKGAARQTTDREDGK